MDIEFSLLSLQHDYREDENAGQPPTDVVELFRSGLRQIEDTVQAMVRATIGDRHHDRFAVLKIHHSDHRPSGNDQQAAVSLRRSNLLPLAILRPWCCLPYQEAIPTQRGPEFRVACWLFAFRVAADIGQVQSRQVTMSELTIRSFVCISIVLSSRILLKLQARADVRPWFLVPPAIRITDPPRRWR